MGAGLVRTDGVSQAAPGYGPKHRKVAPARPSGVRAARSTGTTGIFSQVGGILGFSSVRRDASILREDKKRRWTPTVTFPSLERGIGHQAVASLGPPLFLSKKVAQHGS